MKCIHCGSEIGQTHRFCSVCGKEQSYSVLPQPVPAPMPRPVSPPPRKKGGALKWVLVSLWLGLVVLGWIAAFLLLPGSQSPAEKQEEAGRVSLTEGIWYQWEPEREELYCWEFAEDGTVTYGPAQGKARAEVGYRVSPDTGDVVIGYSGDNVTWHYDSDENCYWQEYIRDGQIRKVRIFHAARVPQGAKQFYQYRVDDGTANVAVFYDSVTTLTRGKAEEIVEMLTWYQNFGVCNTEAVVVTGPEAESVYSISGLDWEASYLATVYRLDCCHSREQMYDHLRHYLGPELVTADILQENVNWGGAIEFGGSMYYIILPMGYYGYYVVGDPVDNGDGTWTVPLQADLEEDLYAGIFGWENGTIKLLRIVGGETIQNTADLSEEVAWDLVQKAYCFCLEDYFADDGLLDYSDVYVLRPSLENPDFRVECPSVHGVDTRDDLYLMLARHFTDDCIQERFMRTSYYSQEIGGNVYGGSWFETNGTIYFEPNWGAGVPMLFRDTMYVASTGNNTWRVSVNMEFSDEPFWIEVVLEDGTYKVRDMG